MSIEKAKTLRQLVGTTFLVAAVALCLMFSNDNVRQASDANDGLMAEHECLEDPCRHCALNAEYQRNHPEHSLGFVGSEESWSIVRIQPD